MPLTDQEKSSDGDAMNSQQHSPTGRGIQHRAALALLAIMLLIVFALLFTLVKPIKVMPYLAAAPTFSLIDQHGQPISDADLHGYVVLYDFIYTFALLFAPL